MSLSRGRYPDLEAAGVHCVQGSILSPTDLEKAMEGCDGVIHTAGKVGSWGREKDYIDTNVKGTENVVKVAQKCKVGRLVQTSSPSVVFGNRDICGGNESLPYPKHYYAHYPRTKMLAEKHVLNSHGEKYLATTSLRPHLIWGPGDPHFMPRLREQAKSLKKVGDLKNKVDVTYVDNAAEEHVLALEDLSLESPNGGRAYFVGQEQPVELWSFIDRLMDCMGLAPVQGRVPSSLAYSTGIILEALYRLRGIYDREPPMTRFVAFNLTRSCYFSHAQATRDLRYKPRVSTDEGLKRVRESFQ